MTNIIVDIPLFFTGEEGWLEAEDPNLCTATGGSVLIGSPIVRKSSNYLFVAEYPENSPQSEIKNLISEGMKKAHQEAQAHMIEEFGEDWKSRSWYRFGSLNYCKIES